MRILGAVMLVAMLAACGPSRGEREQERYRQVMELAEQCQADARSAAAARETQCQEQLEARDAEVRQVRQRVLDGLQEVTDVQDRGNGVAEFSGWEVTVDVLEAGEWRWSEQFGRGAADDKDLIAEVNTMRYSVNPANLDPRVVPDRWNDGRRDFPAVRIACIDGTRCITARGQVEVVDTTRGQSDSEAVEQRQNQNFWPVRSSSDSGRVANDLSDLITMLRRDEPAVCTAEPAPDCRAQAEAALPPVD